MLNLKRAKPTLPTQLGKPIEREVKESVPPIEGQPDRLLQGSGEFILRDFKNVYFPLTVQKFVRASATSHDLESNIVPPGRMWVITSLCAIDSTSGFTSLRWLIGQTGYDHFLDEVTTIAVNNLIAYRFLPLYLGEGRSVIARLAGVVSGDDLRMFGNGIEVVLR